MSTSADNNCIRGLYAITPPQSNTEATRLEQVTQAIQGGAGLVQYRNKQSTITHCLDEARALLYVCRYHKVPLIINDDIELALTIGANGVHLGRDDSDPLIARQRLGPKALIGVSCYNSLQLAQQAAATGANYVAFGSFFTSTTKPLATPATPDLLRMAKNTLSVPIVAIGGITTENGKILITAGADMLAVINALFTSPNVFATAQAFTRLFSATAH